MIPAQKRVDASPDTTVSQYTHLHIKEAFPIGILIVVPYALSKLLVTFGNAVHKANQKGEEINKADLAASFTETLVKSICLRVDALYSEVGSIPLVLAGGVAANSHLRAGLKTLAESKGVPLYLPPLSLCGDNAAMIASQGYFEYLSGSVADLKLNAFATKTV